MNDQSGNEENLKREDNTPVTKLNTLDQCSESSTSSESVSKLNVVSSRKNETVLPNVIPSPLEEPTSNLLITETLIHLEETNHELIVNEKLESVKQKAFKLPTESDACGTSELAPVGDDATKKGEVNILCECEPNVAGAAVPAVKSFIPSENKNSIARCANSSCNLSENSERHQSPHKYGATSLKNKEITKHVSRISQKHKNDVLCSQVNNKCIKPIVEKPSPEIKCLPKKPSLIPKPTRLTGSSYKNLNNAKDDTEKRESVNHSRLKSNVQKPSKTNYGTLRKPENNSNISQKNAENTEGSSNVNTISSRMIGLQERLKATTSMLRQKIEMDKTKQKVSPEEVSPDLSAEAEINRNMANTNKKTIDDLYKSIFCLKDIASALSENSTFKSQTKYIEKLFINISEIQLIADKLCMNESKSKEDESEDKSSKSSSTNAKDNKIYIKFMQTKDRKNENKKKRKENLPIDQSDEIHTDIDLSSKLTSDSLHSDVCPTEKNPEENKIKESDSLDGIFIPSCEPPKHLEDDEETNGLDITITFPEFSQLYTNGNESHLSVCLSDISAEALKKLKRCPKDFTLKMDFVEGKVLFQSGKGPANNFQIGPDLKFAENIVDSKKSDVISIKPSTECSFGSQLIPVENPKEIKSFKSLKSTDSELFNVVSLPFVYKNPYITTGHKSCITFRNDQLVSMAILAKHIFKSMPQIPSLTNIFEDTVMDSPSKTGSRKKT